MDTNALKHEFHTTIAKAELSTALLGEEGVAAAEANCTPKQTQVSDKCKKHTYFVERCVCVCVDTHCVERCV